MPVTVISFGHRHAPAPAAHLIVDVRDLLDDPHFHPDLWHLTGLEPVVADHVANTPGAAHLADHIVNTVRDLHQEAALGRNIDQVVVAIGCVGGRHRSVALAETVTANLNQAGIRANVEHRDIGLPPIDVA